MSERNWGNGNLPKRPNLHLVPDLVYEQTPQGVDAIFLKLLLRPTNTEAVTEILDNLVLRKKENEKAPIVISAPPKEPGDDVFDQAARQYFPDEKLLGNVLNSESEEKETILVCYLAINYHPKPDSSGEPTSYPLKIHVGNHFFIPKTKRSYYLFCPPGLYTPISPVLSPPNPFNTRAIIYNPRLRHPSHLPRAHV